MVGRVDGSDRIARVTGAEADQLIAAMAARQDGQVARSQLLAQGITARMIHSRLRRGLLHRAHPGVYSVGIPRRGRRGGWWAAVLAAGPRESGEIEPAGTLGLRSSAALIGLRRSDPAVVDVFTPWRKRGPAGIRFHCEQLPDDEITHAYGIPTTTPVRTVFDLAGVLQPAETEAVINEAEAQGLWDRLSLPDLLERHPHRRGNVVLRRILAADRIGSTHVHEGAEEQFIAFLDAHRLTRPVTNTMIAGASGRTYEGDCVWGKTLVNVEVDSRFHDTPAAGERDVRRDLDLEAAGWTIIRLRARTIREEPAMIAARLRQLVGARA